MIQRDDDFVDVTNVTQDIDDALEGWSFKFRIERREDQRDRSRFCIPFQFLLQLLGIGLTEPV